MASLALLLNLCERKEYFHLSFLQLFCGIVGAELMHPIDSLWIVQKDKIVLLPNFLIGLSNETAHVFPKEASLLCSRRHGAHILEKQKVIRLKTLCVVMPPSKACVYFHEFFAQRDFLSRMLLYDLALFLIRFLFLDSP